MKIRNISLLCVLAVLLYACSDKGDAGSGQLEGKYSGTFYYGSSLSSVGPKYGAVSITFTGNKYACTGNPDRIPAGGLGTFAVHGDKITFTDTNVWTADFDWNLTLNGEYAYETRNDTIFISKTVNPNQPLGLKMYEYMLKKK